MHDFDEIVFTRETHHQVKSAESYDGKTLYVNPDFYNSLSASQRQMMFRHEYHHWHGAESCVEANHRANEEGYSWGLSSVDSEQDNYEALGNWLDTITGKS